MVEIINRDNEVVGTAVSTTEAHNVINYLTRTDKGNAPFAQRESK